MPMRKAFSLLAALSTLLIADTAWAQRCEHSRDIEVNSIAPGAASARISVGAGDLRVEGSDGDAVIIRGRACASSAAVLEEISVRTSLDGERLEIETEMPEGSWSWSGSSYAYVDLEIRLPANLAVSIDDGSGDAFVGGLASVEIDDGSGKLEVRDVAGSLSVSDGSGDLEVAEVGGEVRISDGSGDMTVRGAGGVIVESDGSGSIRIERTRGSVTVENDGSGNIVVDGVEGDFVVDNDGSGSIRYDNVSGRVDIPERKR
jgi:hypothetical protein